MSIRTTSSAGLSIHDVFAPDTQARGRNGDDRVWEAAHQAIMSKNFGQALEMVLTLNAFFQAYAVDELVDAADLRRWGMACEKASLASKLASEVQAWNQAVRKRFGLL